MQHRRLLLLIAVLVSICYGVFAKSNTLNPLEILVRGLRNVAEGLRDTLSNKADDVFINATAARVGSFTLPSGVSLKLSSAIQVLRDIKTGPSSNDENCFLTLEDALEEAFLKKPEMKEIFTSLTRASRDTSNDPTNRAEVSEVCLNLIKSIAAYATEKSGPGVNLDLKVSFVGKVKYYSFKFAGLLVGTLASSLNQVLEHIVLTTIILVATFYAAVHISIRLGLAFFRVLFWIIKLPFRALRAVFRFIFRQDKKLELDASMETLIAECSANESTEGAAVNAEAKQQSVPRLSRRLTEFDDAYAEDALVEELDDELIEDLAEEEPLEGLDLAEKPKEGPPASDSKVKPVVAPSSAAVVGSVAAFVAAIALLV